MDKMLFFIIIFLAIVVTMSAILAMGAVPKIFQTGEQVNKTQETLNQTQLIIMAQQQRDNQTRHEDEEREKQSAHFLNQINFILLEHHNELQSYIDKQNNTTQKLLQNQENMIRGIETLLNTTVKQIADNQLIIQKYGTENNAIGRAIAKELGMNITKILDEYYTKNNMTPIYPPPPSPSAN
jgi:type II secretory pathway pseudopilin PulG